MSSTNADVRILVTYDIGGLADTVMVRANLTAEAALTVARVIYPNRTLQYIGNDATRRRAGAYTTVESEFGTKFHVFACTLPMPDVEPPF